MGIKLSSPQPLRNAHQPHEQHKFLESAKGEQATRMEPRVIRIHTAPLGVQRNISIRPLKRSTITFKLEYFSEYHFHNL